MHTVRINEVIEAVETKFPSPLGDEGLNTDELGHVISKQTWSCSRPLSGMKVLTLAL